MKRVILGLALMLGIFSVSKTYAQDPTVTTTTTYWYYPSENVYYNEVTGDYWYYDNPTTTWMTVKTLPNTYVVTDKTHHVDVTYAGTDVWKENKEHLMKYKMKKNGKMKVKPKS
ncbi:MAG: hypothetical protein V4556_09495 [Bacteroidota bacterium]